MPALEIIDTEIRDVKIVTPPRFGDHRGYFSETWSARAFAEAGLGLHFVQENQSMSAAAGTVRGLHYQITPHAQTKLVRAVHGTILDVAVDIRRCSPTFGRHVAVELSEENGRQLLVPIGFAHGFVTRTPNAIVLYKVTAFYAPAHERGLLWSDAQLSINWGVPASAATLAERDLKFPFLRDAADLFD